MAVGYAFLIIPGIFLGVMWSLISPAIVVEGKAFDAIGRSWQLVKGHFWSVFGIYLVVGILIFAVAMLSIIIGAGIGGAVGVAVVGFVLLVLVAPVDGLMRSIIYFTLASGIAQSAGASTPAPPAPPAPGGDVPPPPPGA